MKHFSVSFLQVADSSHSFWTDHFQVLASSPGSYPVLMEDLFQSWVNVLEKVILVRLLRDPGRGDRWKGKERNAIYRRFIVMPHRLFSYLISGLNTTNILTTVRMFMYILCVKRDKNVISN